jgi:hypothetical protein
MFGIWKITATENTGMTSPIILGNRELYVIWDACFIGLLFNREDGRNNSPETSANFYRAK